MRLFLGVAILLAAASATAHDWPQWRGPARTGAVDWVGPESWPESLQSVWNVAVGEGHASPAVVGDRVFVFARVGGDEVVRALRLSDGHPLWEKTYRVPYEMEPAAVEHGKGPKSSPLVDGSRVFTFGIQGMVSAHDIERGDLLWQENTDTSPYYGHAMSPVVVDGKLIVHIGESGEGALTAFDVASGDISWKFQGDGPAYTSPIVVELDGHTQAVTQTESRIVGVRIADGTLLWSLPFKTPYDQNTVTPILYEKTLVLAGLENRTFAIELDARTPRQLWANDLTFYMSTPVLHGNELIGFSDKRSGHFVAIDADTGETLWTGAPRQGENAALVLAGKWLLTLTEDATLRVVDTTTDGFEPLRTYTVADSPTWAHPVPTDAGILIKDKGHLTLWSTR